MKKLAFLALLAALTFAKPNSFDGTGNIALSGHSNTAHGHDNTFDGIRNKALGNKNRFKGNDNKAKGNGN